jgi:RNA polymerase sigma-70 factor (ECF subfamily)
VGNKYKNIHQSIIDKCKKGDTTAQFDLYKLYYKAMYNTCLRIVNNSIDAEDIMQEAFLKAFDKINSYKGEVSFGAWLKKIVVNSSLDFLKKKKIETDEIDERKTVNIADENSHYDDIQMQKINKIKKAVAELPENYRVLILLYLFEGYDHEEISQILEMSYAAVRTGYSRAKKRLQEILNKKETAYG